MIRFHQFVAYMKKEQVSRFEGRLTVNVEKVKINNGVFMTSLQGRRPDSQEWVTIGLDSYYMAYREGMSLKQLADDIYDMFNTLENPNYPLDGLGDWEQAKDKIFYKLVNYEKNLELLKDIPHIPYLDLAITFHVMVERNEKGQSTCPILHEHTKVWEKGVDQFYELARENTKRLFPASLRTMEEVMIEIIKDYERSKKKKVKGILEDFLSCGLDPSLYILGNTCGLYGAAVVLYEDILKDFAERIKEDIIILPSSIHEVLLVPNSKVHDIEEMKAMVEHINRTEVSKTDVLSDNVYLYSREKNLMTMI